MPNADDIDGVKSGLGPKILLNDKRHAEDEWFRRHFTAFRIDVQNTIRNIPALKYDCNSSVLEQVQSETRIVFQVTANPCLSDDRVNDKGCVHYFSELLRPVAGKVPIMIYWHRPYDPAAAVQRKHVFTIKEDGAHAKYPNSWVQP
jgi:hypothetical protein